jgi:lysophospholipase L1-like esterase
MKLALMVLAWVGTWATAPQPFMPGSLETYRNETLRLIVHVSEGGHKVRIRISNTYGDKPLSIGSAHVALRTMGADVDPTSDRSVTFHGHSMITIPPHGMVVSDPADLDLPALSDLAVSLFLPQDVEATTSHLLALQTSYVTTGDSTSAIKFPVAKTIDTWPFLTGVDVIAPHPAAIVVVGSSTTDGDGSTQDQNHRWPDALAERLQTSGAGHTLEVGVLNEGIIGNRLLKGSTNTPPFGAALGESVLSRFQRDVLDQAGVRFVIVCIGVNDIVFPGAFTPSNEIVTAESLIVGYRQLIARAHKKGIRIYSTTIPPFENAIYKGDAHHVYTPEKEATRSRVNEWLRNTHEFDAVIDFDAVLLDPNHPTRLLAQFDSGDHLHSNDAGYVATAAAVPLELFRLSPEAQSN